MRISPAACRRELTCGITGQDLFFHLNHPIKWVRVAGVVVAIDEYGGRRVYTIDDSSGVNIECLIIVPLPKDSSATSNDIPKQETAVPTPPGLDVGAVVAVKGGLQTFRGQKQIKAEKITLVGSTEHEVQFWAKVHRFRKDVLDQPWILDRRVVRKLRKEAERDYGDEERAKRRKAKEKEAETKASHRPRREEKLAAQCRRPRGRETKAKLRNLPEGKFKALGL